MKRLVLFCVLNQEIDEVLAIETGQIRTNRIYSFVRWL